MTKRESSLGSCSLTRGAQSFSLLLLRSHGVILVTSLLSPFLSLSFLVSVPREGSSLESRSPTAMKERRRKKTSRDRSLCHPQQSSSPQPAHHHAAHTITRSNNNQPRSFERAAHTVRGQSNGQPILRRQQRHLQAYLAIAVRSPHAHTSPRWVAFVTLSHTACKHTNVRIISLALADSTSTASSLRSCWTRM
jgi:hypothetical protein